MRAKALASQAVVAARILLTRLRIDPQRREHHRSLPLVLPYADRVFRRHIDDEPPMLGIAISSLGGKHHDVPHIRGWSSGACRAGALQAPRRYSEHWHGGVSSLVGRHVH